MAKLSWTTPGARVFETGVSKGVLYRRGLTSAFDKATPWVGLTAITESPSGAESNKQYADNGVYANLISAEEFAATIEAFTYPAEFAACDGTAEISEGISIGQQKRETFGLCYRTEIGNDVAADAGYKLHIIYGALAAPTEKANNTINDSPEASTFSWELSTTPVEVPGFKPTSLLTIDSTKVDPEDLAALEDLLYGTATVPAELPTPAEILALVEVTP